MRDQSSGGADLSYDFVTRPAYEHALLTGDAEFLRLIFQLMRQYKIDPAGLIHALQNHDELDHGTRTVRRHACEDRYSFRGAQVSGKQLRAIVHADMYGRLIGDNTTYNLKFGDGVASTTATVITSALGIKDLSKLTPADIEKIKRIHLLLAFYNAFQPGVFALSGWDLVGALTLPAAVVKDRLADGDTRWINRGAYDLIGSNPKAKQSAAGLPVAVALYGPLPKQLKKPDSFASQLARMLKVRADLHLYAAQLIDYSEGQLEGSAGAGPQTARQRRPRGDRDQLRTSADTGGRGHRRCCAECEGCRRAESKVSRARFGPGWPPRAQPRAL